MRFSLLSSVLLTLTTLSLQGAETYVLTRPELPKTETLQRLGLKKRWQFYLPMDGTRDGIGRIAVVDRKGGTHTQVGAQTRSGIVTVLDAETGKTDWQMRLGERYRTQILSGAANAHTFFVVAGEKIYAIDRQTGTVEGSRELPGALSAAPAVDDNYMFLCSGNNRVYAFQLPASLRSTTDTPAKPKEDEASSKNVFISGGYGVPAAHIRAPNLLWQFQSETSLPNPPLMLDTHAVFADSSGLVRTVQKDKRIKGDAFETHGKVTAPLARYGSNVFVASEDHNLYAFDVAAGQLNSMWRYTTGSPVDQKPMVFGDDVCVVSRDQKLFCLDRKSGQPRWQKQKVDRCVGASKRFVFAADSLGQLLVLDRQKGQLVGTLDTRDYAFLVPNDVTDRIYLANHDGLVLCLQDMSKEHDQPHAHTAPPPKPQPKPDEPMPMEPAPMEEKKP